MAPAAATAAARISAEAVPAPAPRRTPHVRPVSPPEVEPVVTRRGEQIRIRRSRESQPGAGLRQRDRRWSGDDIRGLAAAASAATSARVSIAGAAERVELPRIELPAIDFGRIFRRPRPVSVPNPASLASAVRTAPDHSITRRLVSSRSWIGLVAVLGAGIVFIQVQTLHINSGIGADVQKISSLQRENAGLRTAVSGLSSDQRIVAEAQRMGFVEPPVGSTRFAAFHHGDSVRAVGALSGSAATGGLSDSSAGAGAQSAGAAGDVGQVDSSGALADTGGSGTSQALQSGTGTSGQGATTTAAVPDGGSSPQTG